MARDALQSDPDGQQVTSSAILVCKGSECSQTFLCELRSFRFSNPWHAAMRIDQEYDVSECDFCLLSLLCDICLTCVVQYASPQRLLDCLSVPAVGVRTGVHSVAVPASKLALCC